MKLGFHGGTEYNTGAWRGSDCRRSRPDERALPLLHFPFRPRRVDSGKRLRSMGELPALPSRWSPPYCEGVAILSVDLAYPDGRIWVSWSWTGCREPLNTHLGLDAGSFLWPRRDKARSPARSSRGTTKTSMGFAPGAGKRRGSCRKAQSSCATCADIRVLMLDGPQAWKSRDNGLEHARVSERQLNTACKTGLPGDGETGHLSCLCGVLPRRLRRAVPARLAAPGYTGTTRLRAGARLGGELPPCRPGKPLGCGHYRPSGAPG